MVAGICLVGFSAIYGQPSCTIDLGPNPSVCQGTTVANLTYSSTTGDRYRIEFDPFAQAQLFTDVPITTLPASPIEIIVPPGAASGTYNAMLTILSSVPPCLSNTYPITISVITPTLLFGGHDVDSVDACVGYNPSIVLSINDPVLSGGLAPYTYQWQLNEVDIIGEVNPTFTPPVLMSPDIYRYRCVIEDACGNSLVTEPKVITIFDDPSVSITGPVSACVNTNFDLSAQVIDGTEEYTYRWESSPTGIDSWDEIGISRIPTYTLSEVTSGTHYYRLVISPDVPSCDNATSDVILVDISPNNTITLNSAPTTDAQTVCINTPITPITYATTGATGATITGLPTGVTGAWASNVVTISGTPTVAGAALTYTVSLTGGCGTISTTGTIAVTA
ncbi:MAG: hypothetical protein GX646_01880, partial [Bacteroidales bacterium]|nr:hypothetical protein [Bacteroidales bacterium]